MPLPLLLACPALLAPPAAPRPLPFRFQAGPAYGEPDRFDDRAFDAFEFRDRAGKAFRKEGRFLSRQWHFRKESGEEKPSTLWVYRNGENAFRSLGAEFLWTDPGHQFHARLDIDGKAHWIRFEAGGDYFGMTLIQEEPMKQVFTADLLASALEKEGFATLDVRFKTDSAEILPESGPLLDQAAEVLKAHGDWKISVEGHTDSSGNAPHNLALSEDRARSVAAALRARGIPAARLASAGYGSGRPVADNRTEEGRARNRRVELVRP